MIISDCANDGSDANSTITAITFNDINDDDDDDDVDDDDDDDGLLSALSTDAFIWIVSILTNSGSDSGSID